MIKALPSPPRFPPASGQHREESASRLEKRTAELAAARGQLETLVTTLPLCMVAVDRSLKIRMWNPAAEELFGWKKAEVLGKPLPIYPKGLRPETFAELEQALPDCPSSGCAVQRRRRDGALVEVHAWRAPLRDHRGAVIGCLAFFLDLTERKRLEQALLEASEREQRRIGQDLHDQLCQQLLGVACTLKALASVASSEHSAHATELQHAARLVSDAIRQTRDIARGLHPAPLTAEGLLSALRGLAAQTSASSIACRLDCPRPVLVEDAQAALNLYRIAQEAVANAVRHARAKHIFIRLREEKGGFKLQIEDDGAGFPVGSADCGPGMGLDLMQSRARTSGGRLSITSSKAGGTCVTCLLPNPLP